MSTLPTLHKYGKTRFQARFGKGQCAKNVWLQLFLTAVVTRIGKILCNLKYPVGSTRMSD